MIPTSSTLSKTAMSAKWPMAEAARAPGQDAKPSEAATDPASPWPSVHSRRRGGQHTASVVDPADATAWSMPYTDLTMLLMVFFIVMLSLVGPNPATPREPGETTPDNRADATDTRPHAAVDITDRAARTVFEGGDGIFEDSTGVLPDGARVVPPQDDLVDTQDAERGAQDNAAAEAPPSPRDMLDADFAEAWAERVSALETETQTFLAEAGLEDLVRLNRGATGIELRLPDNLLFSSGHADIQVQGMDLLMRVAPLLERLNGEVQVSGHTDNVPIQTPRFPSNWELSAARAIAVVRLLHQLGLPETKLQAVGHGANRPIASNTHAAGRAINRRVSIDITPLPQVHETGP